MASSPSYLSIYFVNIYVRDQERSVRFYVDQLGFDLAFDARLQGGRRWVAVAPPDGSTVLSLIQPERDSAEYKLIGRATQVVLVTEDVTATYREWRNRGVRFGFTPRLRRVKYERASPPGKGGASAWGGVFTRFEDIDRNSFTLVSIDEMSRTIQAQRQAVAEKLEAERRAAQELEIAKQVQARLFPQTQPACGTLDYAGICIQALQVGGDYYDFLDLGPQRLGLVVGDIAGKGMAAALLMANLQANLRSQYAAALDQPQLLLRSVNQLFYENTVDSAYATLFFAEYDGRTERLRYVNCGHLPALLLRGDDSMERLGSTCTVLGLFKEWDCALGENDFHAGDTLLLYTDGVTEAFNDAGDEFGEKRLMEALRRHRQRSSRDLLAAVVDEVRQFSPHEQQDDITLIVAKCQAS
ncbi:MAG: SpoIIE family protein phosphatase [Bryobacteraceae bacterium]|jgi:serine phosphatase RsbU (regulator of sigma subunit)/predicted enzyme related to lactoylglutathione lyase